MTDADDRPDAGKTGAKTPPAASESRRARQAEALRANLRKRRAQARERDDGDHSEAKPRG